MSCGNKLVICQCSSAR